MTWTDLYVAGYGPDPFVAPSRQPTPLPATSTPTNTQTTAPTAHQ